MIVKEQYAAPAIRHEGKTKEQMWESLESWTVMVKDASGSHDGWFWSNPVKGQCVVDNHEFPFDHPVSGFGHYCLRCHAATRSPGAETAMTWPGRPGTMSPRSTWRQSGRARTG